MADLKISTEQISSFLEGISPGVEPERLSQHFAYLAWSLMCEPGDGLAGFLVQSLGSDKALELILNGASAQEVYQALEPNCEPNIEFIGEEEFQKAYADGLERWGSRKSLAELSATLELVRGLGGSTVSPVSTFWPAQLFDLGVHSPMVLWCRGKVANLERLNSSIAVVGSRAISAYGHDVTAEFVAAATAMGLIVISGGALGVDGRAHSVALATQGKTIAVMAGGVDRFYPSAHSELLHRISKEGLVVSEMPPGTAPTKWRFLQRNRLIAALSPVTLVVEANWRSGALSTARHALALERTLLAVPGQITSAMSVGCNQLIRDGLAQPVIRVEDLRTYFASNESRLFGHEGSTDISGQAQDEIGMQVRELGALETRAYDAIGFGAPESNEIATTAGLTRSEAHIALSSLELEGFIVRRGSGWARSQTIV